jgi:hypothetical protein
MASSIELVASSVVADTAFDKPRLLKMKRTFCFIVGP